MGPLYISRELVKSVQFVAILVGSTGMTAVWGLLSRLQPNSINYHHAALALVDELAASSTEISAIAHEMRNRIEIKLTPCHDPRNAKLCEKKLEEVARELAEIVKDKLHRIP